MMDEEITARDARKAFLNDAPRILAVQKKLATEFEAVTEGQRMLYDTLSKMMTSIGDAEAIEAKSTNDVLTLLSKGKVSAIQALYCPGYLRA
jgi:hypothetical protein